MVSTVELAGFKGSADDYEKLLNSEVDAGRISEEEADALFAAFNQHNSSTVPASPFPATEDPVAGLQSFVETGIQPEKTFLEKLQEEELKAVSEAASTGQPMTSMSILRNRAASGRDIPVTGMSDEELAKDNSPEALAELERRNVLQNQTFLQSLGNPYQYARTFGAIGKGFGQIGLMPEGMLALGSLGIEKATGLDVGAKERLLSYSEKQLELEHALGLSTALTPIESLAEAASSAVVPGGALTKLGAVGTDFATDQVIRELTDDKGEKYETIFDRIGLTDNNEAPVLGTMAALGVVLLGGALTGHVIDRLSAKRLAKPPKMRLLTDLDPDAPKGLKTVEKAGDLTKTYTVDEQQALRDILRRQGLGNIDDLDARIELDTHSALRTRVEEGINTGKLNTADASFNSSVAPRVLYDAYNGLSKPVKEQVARYINLKDMRDDIVLAIQKGKATTAELFKVDKQIAQIAKAVPAAEQFSKRYNVVTKALRDYAEGSLFSKAYRHRLDKTRSNYVPLEMAHVDENAPFLQRLSQAQSTGGTRDAEWFLQNRDAIGNYDVSRRADPFDMLIQSVEATLTARSKNDTKVAIIDSLLDSDVGKQTIKRATTEEAAKNADRLVRIYRNGEKETYITSKLTAQLLKFDPYIAKYPWAFMPKRLFEQTAVGPLSITFAPVTMLRDAVGGAVTRPKGMLSPSLLDTAKAVPQQLWAKALEGISSHLQQSFVSGNLPFPEWMMDAPAQKRFADNLAQSYTQTLYHQANNAGGFDASLMKNRIEIGHGMLEEVKRTIGEGTRNLPDVPGLNFTKHRIMNMVEGFKHVFNAIQDAPRFGAIAKNVKNGMDVEEATRLARHLTGDVTKSGRVYDAAGKRIVADAVDQGVLNIANKPIGIATEFLREATPFLNPMIQGNRRLLKAMIEDPIGFNLRAWKYIGLPSVAAFGWNEMLGKQYNDYAMNERSGRDVAMNLYIGIPGLPPQQGIEIPLMHELLTYSSPFTRGLYGMARGESSERTRAAFSILAESILSNSLDVGYPVVGQAAANISGFSSPDSLSRPTEGVYKIREDDIGILPQNLEYLARTLFANVGDTALNVAAALSEEPSLDTLGKTLYDSVMSRAPIIKNVTGKKTANTHFSINNSILKDRFDALQNFREYYNAFYEEKRFNEDGLQKPASKKGFTKFPDDSPLANEDLPFLMIGPEQLQDVTNPLYKEFGPIIVDDAFRGEEGMTALLDRERTYSKYVRRLREYNAGDAKALQEWQALLNGIEPADENTAALKELLTQGGYDLSKYDDRVKLINEIEHRNSEIIRSQLDTMDRIEEKITQILREQGRLGPDDKFNLRKHLDPHDPDPLH